MSYIVVAKVADVWINLMIGLICLINDGMIDMIDYWCAHRANSYLIPKNNRNLTYKNENRRNQAEPSVKERRPNEIICCYSDVYHFTGVNWHVLTDKSNSGVRWIMVFIVMPLQ